MSDHDEREKWSRTIEQEALIDFTVTLVDGTKRTIKAHHVDVHEGFVVFRNERCSGATSRGMAYVSLLSHPHSLFRSDDVMSVVGSLD